MESQVRPHWLLQAVGGSGGVGKLSKGTVVSASSFVLESATPPDLFLKPGNSVPPHMLLVLLKLLSLRWSLWTVFLSE